MISPAPYKIDENDEHVVLDVNNEVVARANDYRLLGKGQDAENKRLYLKNCANAKAIKHIPEMLVLIKQFVEMYEDLEGPHKQYYPGVYENCKTLLKEIT